MTDTDGVHALAGTLLDTVRELERHIAERADKLAAQQIDAARTDFDRDLAAVREQTHWDQRRLEDLNAELRRQLDAQVRQVDRHRGLLSQNGIDPRTGLAAGRGASDALITGFARALWSGERDYRDLTDHGWELLSDDERTLWERAATHALESTVDRIIEAGRPVWWTTD
jgi:hypothetical protein